MTSGRVPVSGDHLLDRLGERDRAARVCPLGSRHSARKAGSQTGVAQATEPLRPDSTSDTGSETTTYGGLCSK
jgi:hypothetical protein